MCSCCLWSIATRREAFACDQGVECCERTLCIRAPWLERSRTADSSEPEIRGIVAITREFGVHLIGFPHGSSLIHTRPQHVNVRSGQSIHEVKRPSQA
jgi:hypothetical protein